MKKYKNWHIEASIQNNGTWFGVIIDKNNNRKLSTSYYFSTANNKTKKQAIDICKNYIDEKLNNIK